MKLSDFKKSRKIKFYENEDIDVEGKVLENELEFYPLTASRADEIKAIVDKIKLEEVDSDTEFQNRLSYGIIPYVCSVERDSSYEEFKGLMADPTLPLIVFYESLSDVIDEAVRMVDKLNKLIQKVEVKKEKAENNKNNKTKAIEEVKEVVSRPVETIEEKINRLTKELESETDKGKKKEKFKELADAYTEFEKEN